jgi:hypothetical protein
MPVVIASRTGVIEVPRHHVDAEGVIDGLDSGFLERAERPAKARKLGAVAPSVTPGDRRARAMASSYGRESRWVMSS